MIVALACYPTLKCNKRINHSLRSLGTKTRRFSRYARYHSLRIFARFTSVSFLRVESLIGVLVYYGR